MSSLRKTANRQTQPKQKNKLHHWPLASHKWPTWKSSLFGRMVRITAGLQVHQNFQDILRTLLWFQFHLYLPTIGSLFLCVFLFVSVSFLVNANPAFCGMPSHDVAGCAALASYPAGGIALLFWQSLHLLLRQQKQWHAVVCSDVFFVFSGFGIGFRAGPLQWCNKGLC